MARFSVDGAGDSGRKRKKMPGAAEESRSKTRDLTEGNHSQSQDGMVESEERVVDDEEQEEESAGEEEEEKIEEGGDFGTSNGSQTDVRIDTDVFDCPICCEPFRPPISQCQNGHVVCSPCCISLSGKCPICSRPIGLIRCLALERIIESVQIRCINARYGCDTTLSYLNQDTHHKICNYIPCICPLSSCAFKGSSRSLSHHFERHHRNSAVKISTTTGNALSMICITSSKEESNFEYELSVGWGATLKLKASVESTTEWKGVYPANMFLFVPKGFCSSPNMIFVGVSINKC